MLQAGVSRDDVSELQKLEMKWGIHPKIHGNLSDDLVVVWNEMKAVSSHYMWDISNYRKGVK